MWLQPLLASALGILLGGNRRDFMVGCPMAAAAVGNCYVDEERWLQSHLAVKSFFGKERWTCKVTQLITRTPLVAWILVACH